METITVFGRVIPLTHTGSLHWKYYTTKDNYGPEMTVWFTPAGATKNNVDIWQIEARLKLGSQMTGEGATLAEAEASLRKRLDRGIAGWTALKAELG